MSGLAAGLNGDRNGGAMIDGDRFIGPKAYKDAKLCNILTVKEMSNRWHEETGVTFSTMYPGCIADTPAVPQPHPHVPLPLPHHPEVRHQGLRLHAGGWRPPRERRVRAPVHRVRRVLGVEGRR